MANTYYTVIRGDTLTKIANKYNTTVKNLVAWNKIKNANVIYPNQKLIVGSSNGKVTTKSTASSKNSNSNKVKITDHDIMKGTTNTLFVFWSWNKDDTKEYKVQFKYATSDGHYFDGSETTTTHKQATFDVADHYTKVKVRIKPIAKTKKTTTGSGKNKKTKEVEKWKADWEEKVIVVKDEQNPRVPPTPEGTLDNLRLTVNVSNIRQIYADSIEFQLFRKKNNDNGYTLEYVNKGSCGISNNMASTIFSLAVGQKYKIKARSFKGKEYSDFTEFIPSGDSWFVTKPEKVEIDYIKAISKDEVQVHFFGDKSTAESFELQYTMNPKWFDTNPEKVTTIQITESREYYSITGWEDRVRQTDAAGTYYFRMRGVLGDQKGPWTGNEEWKLIMGLKPSIPTTWSNVETAYIGETIYFYWLHNTMDGSSESNCKLTLDLEPADQGEHITVEIDIPNERSEEYKNSPGVYILNTLEGAKAKINGEEVVVIEPEYFSEDVKINWYVRTCGVTQEYSEKSTTRIVQLYEQPYVNVYITDEEEQDLNIITEFPFYIAANAGPNTQTPIGYHFTIKSKDSYTTVDEIGEEKIISAGDVLYSRYFDPNTDKGEEGFVRNIVLQMLPSNVDLENGKEYELECTVTMDNGLRATGNMDFEVSWIDESFMPDARIIIDHSNYSAQIRPYCYYTPLVHKIVEIINSTYTLTNTITEAGWDQDHENSGEAIENAFVGYEVDDDSDISEEDIINLEEDDLIMVFSTEYEGNTIMYAEVSGDKELVENITLGVYRKEFDGSFTKIEDGILNESQSVIDPHPSLDYARYRITVTKNDTGAISYSDVMEPISGSDSFDYEDRFPGIIIQWDEKWSNFKISDSNDGDLPENLPYAGSLLKLPYNVDISDTNNKDIELIEYIGRENPVSYFGTQIGQTSTWNFEIEADDSETLYGLRRLARWMGNVYVRESSGTGYNAVVSLNISQKHNSLTIPVSMSVTKVEGGI